jgi:hypothetical protein
MKVYTKVVLDWDGNVLEEESFQYEGDVSHCGGSSGGGSGSGDHDWPKYMKNQHHAWMNQIAARLHGHNPYTWWHVPSVTHLTDAYSVATFAQYLANRASELRAMTYSPTIRESELLTSIYNFTLNQIDYLSTHLGAAYEMNENVALVSNIPQLTARIASTENVGDLEGVLDLHTVVYPRFEAGMRDINAVQASTFVIGRGVIEATFQAKMMEMKQNWLIDLEKARTGAVTALSQLQIEARKSNQQYKTSILNIINSCLQLATTSGSSLDNIRMEIDKFKATINMEIRKLTATGLQQLDTLNDSLAAKDLEWRRMSVVALMEQATTDMEHLDKRFRWELENYQYGANMLGAISGGTVGVAGGKTNKVASALGGALSGAAAGAVISVGNPVGAAIGGIVGLGASLF